MQRTTLIALMCGALAVASCVPDPGGSGTTTTTTTTTSTTSTTVLADSDGDGIPDVSDPCPAFYEPAGFCPATPYTIRTGITPIGSPIIVMNVLVTAVDSTNGRAFVQYSPGDFAFVDRFDSAVEIDLGAVTAPSVGDRVTVRGIQADLDLVTVATLDTLSTGNPVIAYVLPDPSSTWPARLDGVFVSPGSATITSQESSPVVWHLASGYDVVEPFVGSLPTRNDGDTVTVVGIGQSDGTTLGIRARTVADIS